MKERSFTATIGLSALLALAAGAWAEEAPAPTWTAHGGGLERDEADGIAVDRLGAVIASGVFRGTATFSGQDLTSQGEGDVFVSKHAPDGTLEWLRQFGSRGEDNTFDVTVDAQGCAILSGWFARTLRLGPFVLRSAGGQDAFVAKLDPQGRVLWAQRFGGPGEDGGNEVAVDVSDEIVVTATSDGAFSVGGQTYVNGGGRDAYVLKLTPNGDVKWVEQLTGAGEARVRAIGTDGAGGVHAGYQFTGEARLGRRRLQARGSWDGLVVSWDASGRRQRILQIGGAGYDLVRGIGGDGQGNVYVSGGFAGTVAIGSETLTSRHSQDDYLLKLDAQGATVWVVQLSGGEDEPGTYGGGEVVVDASGATYLSTKLTGPTRIVGPKGQTRLRPTGERVGCLVAFAPDGDVRWCALPSAGDTSAGGSLAVNAQGTRLAQVVSFRGSVTLGGDSYRARGTEKDFAIVTYDVVPAGPRPGDLPPQPDWRVTRNVVYLPHAKPRNQVALDVYAPVRTVGAPVLCMVHGGSWSSGDKANRRVWEAKARHYVAQGWVFVSLNYRLAPTVQHPTQARDVAAAVAWVHDNAPGFGGDPQQLFLMGHSAGAHLAALVATDGAHLQAAGKSLSVLRGVVCLDSAAYDLERSVELKRSSPVDLYTQAFGPRRNWDDASPITHVARRKGIPPFFLISAGPTSRIVTEEFGAALNGAGVQATVVYAPDRTHEQINLGIGRVGDPYTQQIDLFLAQLQR